MASGIALPDKLFFKIGEVAKLAGVKQHVLRYWESEFPSIKPQKSKTNQRLYRRSDVEAILAVKHLLYDRKFTVEGAREHLKKKGIEPSIPATDIESIKKIIRQETIDELQNEKNILSSNLKRQFQKDLLTIRQQIVTFIKELDQIDS